MQYQNKQVKTSGMIRNRYGVIRALYTGGSLNKKITLYNRYVDDTNRGDEIFTIAYPNAPVSQPELNIPFDSLYAVVETGDGDPNDDSALTVVID